MLALIHIDDTQIAGTEEEQELQINLKKEIEYQRFWRDKETSGVTHSWEEDEQGLKVMVTMNDLI